jgi:hypothetical protein
MLQNGQQTKSVYWVKYKPAETICVGYKKATGHSLYERSRSSSDSRISESNIPCFSAIQAISERESSGAAYRPSDSIGIFCV